MTIAGGLSRLRDEIDRLDARGLVVSTNIPVRNDGLPYSSLKEPDDRGVAVYFTLNNLPHCLACDKWDRVADNLTAVASHIYAIRGQSRWGVGDLAQAFAGYKQLAAMDEKKPWWQLLGFKNPPDDLSTVEAKWKILITKAHPDAGGNLTQATEINAAFTEAKNFYKAVP